MKPTTDELLAVIRRYCLECSGGQRKEVENCKVQNCALRPYRSITAIYGEKAPRAAKGQISIVDFLKSQ